MIYCLIFDLALHEGFVLHIGFDFICHDLFPNLSNLTIHTGFLHILPLALLRLVTSIYMICCLILFRRL